MEGGAADTTECSFVGVFFSFQAMMEILISRISSRGIPLLFYSPPSTEPARKGENQQLDSKEKEKPKTK